MSKFRCRCEHVLIDQTDFLPYKAYLLPDETLFQFLENVENDLATFVASVAKTGFFNRDELAELVTSRVFLQSKRVYQCDHCGRLWVDYQDRNEYLAFQAEDDPWKSVTRALEQKQVPADKPKPERIIVGQGMLEHLPDGLREAGQPVEFLHLSRRPATESSPENAEPTLLVRLLRWLRAPN